MIENCIPNTATARIKKIKQTSNILLVESQNHHRKTEKNQKIQKNQIFDYLSIWVCKPMPKNQKNQYDTIFDSFDYVDSFDSPDSASKPVGQWTRRPTPRGRPATPCRPAGHGLRIKRSSKELNIWVFDARRHPTRIKRMKKIKYSSIWFPKPPHKNQKNQIFDYLFPEAIPQESRESK